MSFRTLGLLAIAVLLSSSSRLAAAGVGEQSVLRVNTPSPADALTSLPSFYPGEKITLTVTGQIDANHEQWEDDECHWLDIFNWFCKKVRRHRSHLRPQSQVGALLQIVNRSGGAPWGHGTPPTPTSSTFTSTPQLYFEPGKSGDGWSYEVDPSGTRATFTVELKPSTSASLLAPVRLKAFIGDRIAGGERLIYDHCDPIRTCSTGALTLTLTRVETDQRLARIAEYLAAERDPTTVTGPHLFDHWLQAGKPDETARLLLRYANQFHPLAGETTETERREILDFALEISNIAKLDDDLLDTLRRERALFHVEAGSLETGKEEIARALPPARNAWMEARGSGAAYVEKRKKGVAYIGWLAAAANAYPKSNENLVSKEVRSAVSLLASASEVLSELIEEAPGGRDVELERDFAHNSVTTARLLTLLRGTGELEEAAQVIDQARAYFPRVFAASLLQSSAAGDFLLLQTPPSRQKDAVPFEERALPPVGWQIVPSTTARAQAFARRGQRFAQLRFEDDPPSIEWLDSPAGTGDLVPVSARPLALIVADAKGRLWRLTPGHPGAVALLEDGSADRRVVASPAANAALALGADGTFLLAPDLDQSGDASGARTGAADSLQGVDLAAIAPATGALARIAWIAAGSGQLQVATLAQDGATGARLTEQVACGGTLPPDLRVIHLAPAAGDAARQAVLLVGRTKLARALADSTGCEIQEIALDEETAKTAGGPWRVWLREDGWLLAPDGRAAGAALTVRASGGAQEALQVVRLPSPASLDRAHIQEVPSGPSAVWRIWTDSVVPGQFQVTTVNSDVTVHWRLPELASTADAEKDLRIAPGSARILSGGATLVALRPIPGELVFYTREPNGRTSPPQGTPLRLETGTVDLRLLDLGSGSALLALGTGADGLVTETHGITRQPDGRWKAQRLDLPEVRIVPQDGAPDFTAKGWRWVEPSDGALRSFAVLVPASDPPADGWTPPGSPTAWAGSPQYQTALIRLSATGVETLPVEVADPGAVVDLLAPAQGPTYLVVRIGASVAAVDTAQGRVSELKQYAQPPQHVEVLRTLDDTRIALVAQDHPEGGYRARADLLAFDRQRGYQALGCRLCTLEATRPDRPPRPYSTTTLDYVGIDTVRCLRILSFPADRGDGSILDMPTGILKTVTVLKNGQKTAPVVWVSPDLSRTEVYDGRRAEVFGQRCKGE